MKTIALGAMLALSAAFLAAPHKPPPAPADAPRPACPHLEAALACSVMVVAESGTGSGVAFHSGARTYVWTDYHVVESSRKADGTFEPVRLYEETMHRGRKSGEKMVMARVIRHSARHDIAVLESAHPGWPAGSASFASGVPAQGDAVWHVGSMHGTMGHRSVSEGVVSAVGRLRLDFKPDDSGVAYDQFCIPALPGSSGGGVFGKADGKLLGLVTEFLGPGHTYGVLCASPARRLREFAAAEKCEFALDASARPE